HGGRQARGDETGEIVVDARDDIAFSGGGLATVTAETGATLDTAAQTGGSATLANAANLTPGTFVFTNANPIAPEYATIVDDGNGVLLDQNNNPVGTIVYTTGVVTFSVAVSNVQANVISVAYNHTNYSRAYAQLGLGGHDADATGTAVGNLGNITVTSGLGSIAFTGGLANESYVQIGHGGAFNSGDNSGSITVEALGAGGEVIFAAGQGGNDTYAQLGHGGRQARGDNGFADVDNLDADNDPTTGVDNAIAVRTSGDIQFLGGNGNRAYAQLGHGGSDADGPDGRMLTPGNRGDITAEAGGLIRFQAGSQADTSAQLGHGGNSA
ncbi:MAG: hypothetical protein KDM91_19230, partial [Verrucomicrobiae bacterium]|nr:hypothetical protein [Verrucomicrobiae bacterium]